MKDMPMFTTEYGVASLFLREIPFRGRAHIKIQSSLDPEKLLEECIGFCKACGAEWIDAAGHEYLEKYPLITALWAMQCPRASIPDTDACLFPMTEDTMQKWLDICNERMADVPNAACMTKQDEKKFLADGDCYFVHRDGKLLGIGKASEDTLHMIASVQRGSGRDVVLAMASLLTGDLIKLTVAKENSRAVALYESLGFIAVREVSRWYKIL